MNEHQQHCGENDVAGKMLETMPDLHVNRKKGYVEAQPINRSVAVFRSDRGEKELQGFNFEHFHPALHDQLDAALEKIAVSHGYIYGREGRKLPDEQVEVVYLTNACGEETGYGASDVTEADHSKVPYEDGPGFVLLYLAEINDAKYVLGNLEVAYKDEFLGGGGEEFDAKDDVRTYCEQVREYVGGRLPEGAMVLALDEYDPGRITVQVAVPLDSLANSDETRKVFADIFGEAAKMEPVQRKLRIADIIGGVPLETSDQDAFGIEAASTGGKAVTRRFSGAYTIAEVEACLKDMLLVQKALDTALAGETKPIQRRDDSPSP